MADMTATESLIRLGALLADTDARTGALAVFVHGLPIAEQRRLIAGLAAHGPLEAQSSGEDPTHVYVAGSVGQQDVTIHCSLSAARAECVPAEFPTRRDLAGWRVDHLASAPGTDEWWRQQDARADQREGEAA